MEKLMEGRNVAEQDAPETSVGLKRIRLKNLEDVQKEWNEVEPQKLPHSDTFGRWATTVRFLEL